LPWHSSPQKPCQGTSGDSPGQPVITTGAVATTSAAEWRECRGVFAEPIPLPDGRELVTLRDAAPYITGLPKAQHDAPEWQAAIEALMLVVEHGGPTMFARVGVMRALNHGHVREFNPDRKDHHWGRRKLRRDGL